MSNITQPATESNQPTSPIFYVKLNSSVGVILGVCAPKQYQLNLKDVVLTGFQENCSFVTVVIYDLETEKIETVVEEVVQNKRDIVLLNIQDFFAPPPEQTQAAENPEVVEVDS